MGADNKRFTPCFQADERGRPRAAHVVPLSKRLVWAYPNIKVQNLFCFASTQLDSNQTHLKI